MTVFAALPAFPAFSLPGPDTWPADPADPVAWRQGRERYGVWVIDADLAPVHTRLAHARAHLPGWLWPSPRQPHITVCVGGFLCTAPRHADDLPPARLAAQKEALQACGVAAFELQIGRLNSFDSAAFLEITEHPQAPPHNDPPGSALARLRAALVGAHTEFRDTPYCPHLTVGLYQRAVPKTRLVAQLAAFEAGPALRLPVRALHFVSYAAGVLGGPLQTEYVHPLIPAVPGAP